MKSNASSSKLNPDLMHQALGAEAQRREPNKAEQAMIKL
jgi:hypothetical protein